MKKANTFLLAIIVGLGQPHVTAAAATLPLKGGENILFIGNSLTASLSESLNDVFKANSLPTFNGHRVQIWNQTFQTHCTISPATHKDLYCEPGKEQKKNIKVKGDNTLLGKGQYNTPEYLSAGWVMAEDAIRKGTPEGKPWDYVILQGYGDANAKSNAISVGPDGKIHAEGPLMIYGGQLIAAAKAAGAQPILYMAWLLNPEQGGGTDNPKSYYNENFDRLIANYNALAKAYDIKVVPVGAAMRVLSKERKPASARVAWLIRDNVHGSACGNALLHYCLASALSGKPATSLNFAFVSKSKWDEGKHYVIGEKEKKYDLVITPEIDAGIKQTALDFLKEYGF